MPALFVTSDPARTQEGTPVEWRLIAAILLALGVGVGGRISRMRTRRVALVSTIAWLMTIGLVHAGTRRARRGARIAKQREGTGGPRVSPRVTIAVAARDETLALPGLIADLGRQTHREPDGSPAFRLVIVDDRSVDGTGETARLAADAAGLTDVTTILRRGPGTHPDGKGAALASIPDDVISGAAVLVLDADARLAPGVVRGVAMLVDDGLTAFTLRRRVVGRDWNAVLQDTEQTVDAYVQRARGGLGGCPEFRGNGMVVTTAALRAVGGWGAGSLTEDLDLSTRLAIAGTTIRMVRDLEVWEAPTGSVPAFARQRLRWAEGSVRRFLGLLPAAIVSRDLTSSAKADIAVSIAELTLPTAVLGAVVLGLCRRTPGPGVAIAAAYIGTAWMLVEMALRDGAHRALDSPSTSMRSAATALYLTHWLVTPPAALLSVVCRTGPVTFARTRDRRLLALDGMVGAGITQTLGQASSSHA